MELTEGAKAYFHLGLGPCNYAWIAEIQTSVDHDITKKFQVDI